MKDLFIFAGQSNMMGAGTFPPDFPLDIRYSREYRHKRRLFGEPHGEFKPADFDCGEFVYLDRSAAYKTDDPTEKSEMTRYLINTLYVPAICCNPSGDGQTLELWDDTCEAHYTSAPSLPPLFCHFWEQKGRQALYCHIAKGGVSIRHYCDDAIIGEVNRKIEDHNRRKGTAIPKEPPADKLCKAAAACFFQTVSDFIADAKAAYPGESFAPPSLFWLQGESDSATDPVVYYYYLEALFAKMRTVGIENFFMIRVGFWRFGSTTGIMAAQELFCRNIPHAYLLTRVASFIPFDRDVSAYKDPVPPEYFRCRDFFLEPRINNHHYNQAGFLTIAKPCADNAFAVLAEGKEPTVEPEQIRAIPTVEI